MKCDDRILLELLSDPELSGEAESPSEHGAANESIATRHVESCVHCQRRLSELAADEDSWHEVGAALSDGPTDSSIVVAVDPELTSDIPLQADHISLEFLAKPSHPEMLGRIGRYDVERLVGAGGMGIVFKAFDTDLHRPVAVKVLAPHLAHSGGARQRFAREAQSAAAVVHENVVPIYNVEADGKIPFLVMQYVAGESLQTRIDKEGPASIDEVLRIGAQIANGLAAAHEQGLVHRDVKPGNILLGDGVDRVLISDFGLARAADDASVTRSGVIAGTPHYMSPEQARGESIDCSSDLFGLGSVLYFMCAGHAPFRANGAMAVLNRICHDTHRPVDEVNEHVPANLANLIDELLAKSPSHRPPGADRVAKQLMSQLHDVRGRARYRRQHRNRNRSLKLLAIGAIGMMAVGLTWWGVDELRSLSTEPNPATASAVLADSTEPVQTVRALSPLDSPPNVPLPVDLPASPDAGYHALAKELDVFHDETFFSEIAHLDAEARALEPHPTLDSDLPLQADRWHDEFSAASEIIRAFEIGAEEVIGPGVNTGETSSPPLHVR